MQTEQVQDFIWKCQAGYPVSEDEVKAIAEWLKANWQYVRRYTR